MISIMIPAFNEELYLLDTVNSVVRAGEKNKIELDIIIVNDGSTDRTSVIIKELEKIPQVLEAHYTTGVYSIFIKIVCKNTQELRDVLNEKIQTIDGVQRTETILSLEESIKRPIAFNIK